MDFLTARAKIERPEAFDGRIKVIGSTSGEHRSGNLIHQDGWKLDNFRKNPVALFEHQEIIGRAPDVKATARGLVFDIQLAEEGTSSTVDYVRSLVRQNLLTTASVGWLPVEGKVKPRKTGGFEFFEQELIEISLVVLPDNPEAVKLAASFGLSFTASTEANDFERRFWDVQTRNVNRLREVEILKLAMPANGRNIWLNDPFKDIKP